MILLWTMAFWRFPHPNPSQLALLVWSQSEKKMTEPPKWETRFNKMGNKSRKAKNKEKEIHLGSKYSLWPSGALRRWLYKGYSRPEKGVFSKTPCHASVHRSTHTQELKDHRHFKSVQQQASNKKKCHKPSNQSSLQQATWRIGI